MLIQLISLRKCMSVTTPSGMLWLSGQQNFKWTLRRGRGRGGGSDLSGERWICRRPLSYYRFGHFLKLSIHWLFAYKQLLIQTITCICDLNKLKLRKVVWTARDLHEYSDRCFAFRLYSFDAYIFIKITFISQAALHFLPTSLRFWQQSYKIIHAPNSQIGPKPFQHHWITSSNVKRILVDTINISFLALSQWRYSHCFSRKLGSEFSPYFF